MKEGGEKLIAILLIGMVLVAFASFLYLLASPLDEQELLSDLDKEEIGEIDFEIDTSPPITQVCKKGETLFDGKCVSCIGQPCVPNEECSYCEEEECVPCPGTECVGGTCVLKTDLSEAPTPFSGPSADFNNLIELLFDFAIPFALLFSYSIVALGFMISKIFSSREAEIWAKIELREVLISTMFAAIIVASIPVFNSLLDSFSEHFTTYNSNEMFVKLLDQSFIPIKGTISSMFVFSSMAWLTWNPTSRAGLPFYPDHAIYLNYSHFYNFSTYINFFNLFANTFVPILFSAMVSIMGQIILLMFFEEVLFVFIGLALVMRSFTFTRKMGGTLLAIILGIYFLFKLLLIVQGSVFLNMGLDQTLSPRGDSAFLNIMMRGVPLLMEGLTALFQVLDPFYPLKLLIDCIKSMGPLGGICFLIVPILHIIDIIIATIMTIAGILFYAVSVLTVSVSGPIFLTKQLDSVIINSIASYADVITFAFFMPILNFIIIIAGIKCLAESLGGDPTVVNMLSFI